MPRGIRREQTSVSPSPSRVAPSLFRVHQQNCADAPSLVNVRVPIASQARVEPPRYRCRSLPDVAAVAPPSTCNVIAGNIRIGAPLLRETRDAWTISALACYWILRCGLRDARRKIRSRARGVAENYFTNSSRDAAVSTWPP